MDTWTIMDCQVSTLPGVSSAMGVFSSMLFLILLFKDIIIIINISSFSFDSKREGVSTCHGHCPGGQSSPLTMRVVPMFSDKISSSKIANSGRTLLLLVFPGSEDVLDMDWCWVELVLRSVRLDPVASSFVVFWRSYLKTVRVFPLMMAPHLKGSVRDDVKLRSDRK